MSSKSLATNLCFSISGFRKTQHGGIKLTLDIPASEAGKALTLALQEETLFSADIFVDDETFGRTA